MPIATYVEGAEQPNITRDWYAPDGTLIDFASGWTFTVLVGVPGTAAVVEKTDGITGAATAPNVTVNFEAGELDDLTPGRWSVQIVALHTLTQEQRILDTALLVRPAIAPVPS